MFFFFFKQKTAYEMRISDWSSDVCSSDLVRAAQASRRKGRGAAPRQAGREAEPALPEAGRLYRRAGRRAVQARSLSVLIGRGACPSPQQKNRSEEHTSELQSLMRISYAVFCLKKKKINPTNSIDSQYTYNHAIQT